MARSGCQKMRETETRGRCRLKAAIAPATIKEEPRNIRPVNKGGAVHTHIHYATPTAQQTCTTKHRHKTHRPLADIFDHRQIATRGISVIAVNIAAEHQATFIRLTKIELTRTKRNNTGDYGL